MQLITLNEALQWKGNCVARLCTLGGRHFCFAQPNIIGLAVWWGWCEKIDLSRAPPASHCVDKRRLLTGVTGVMAPPWHIKKWNQIQEGQRARTVSWPAFASNFCIWQSLPLLKTGMGWPVVTSSLRSALLGPISVWLTQIILLSWPVWIRQVFTSLPFSFTETSVSITSILSYWALRKGRRALWGLSIWWKEAGCSLPQLAGGLQCPEDWLAAPLGPPEPRWGVLEPGVPRIQPKTLCHSELIVMCSRKKKNVLTSLLWFTHLTVWDVGWRDLSSEDSWGNLRSRGWCYHWASGHLWNLSTSASKIVELNTGVVGPGPAN